VAAILLFHVRPGTSPLYPPCAFHVLTGLYCPGCGSTRALYALLHGRPGEALAMNPLLLVVLAWFAYLGGYYLVRRRASPMLRWRATAWVWFGVMILYGLLRNIPAWPFNWLAPG